MTLGSVLIADFNKNTMKKSQSHKLIPCIFILQNKVTNFTVDCLSSKAEIFATIRQF
jgi:hypothetical protein